MGLSRCAATIGQEGLDQRTSLAIGREVGSLTITNKTEETGGRIHYTARAGNGTTYHYYSYSATAFQQTMSFGQTPHSDAVCTQMGGKTAPALPAASCNALSRAAGRC